LEFLFLCNFRLFLTLRNELKKRKHNVKNNNNLRMYRQARILMSMSVFVKATAAPTPRTEASKQVSLCYAGILTVMAVAQLFTLEEFMEYVTQLQLPFTQTMEYLFVPLLIITEVFAIPFLLRMRLSPAMRVVSMAFGWVVAIAWIFVNVWIVSQGIPVESVGFLGAVIAIIPGWWAVFVSVALLLLAIWSSWGLLSGRRPKN
jgi:hypothetical protein